MSFVVSEIPWGHSVLVEVQSTCTEERCLEDLEVKSALMHFQAPFRDMSERAAYPSVAMEIPTLIEQDFGTIPAVFPRANI